MDYNMIARSLSGATNYIAGTNSGLLPTAPLLFERGEIRRNVEVQCEHVQQADSIIVPVMFTEETNPTAYA